MKVKGEVNEERQGEKRYCKESNYSNHPIIPTPPFQGKIINQLWWEELLQRFDSSKQETVIVIIHVVTPATSRLTPIPPSLFPPTLCSHTHCAAWLECCHLRDTYGPLNYVGIYGIGAIHFLPASSLLIIAPSLAEKTCISCISTMTKAASVSLQLYNASLSPCRSVPFPVYATPI